jgi:hypothetical protein
MIIIQLREQQVAESQELIKEVVSIRIVPGETNKIHLFSISKNIVIHTIF